MINIWRQLWLCSSQSCCSVGVQRALRYHSCPALLYRPAGSRNRQTHPYSDPSGDSGFTSHPCGPSMLIQLERFNFTVQVKKSGCKQLQSTHVPGHSSAAAARLAARPRAVTERPTPAVLRQSPERGGAARSPLPLSGVAGVAAVFTAPVVMCCHLQRARAHTHTRAQLNILLRS